MKAKTGAWTIGAALLLAAPSARAVPLLQMDRTAQSQSLGELGAGLDGLDALGANPAGLHGPRAEALMQYQRLPLGTSLALLGASAPVKPIGGTLALSYASLRSAGFDGRDEQGEPAGAFAAQDQLFGLHASRPVDEGGVAALGGSVKLLRMEIAGRRADALAFDVGGLARLPALPLTVGLSALNLGRGPSFGGERSRLPSAYALSAAYRLAPGLEVLAGYSRRAGDGADQLDAGVQCSIGGALSLRARAGSGTRGAPAGLAALSGGAGFKLWGRHSIDYAFHPLDDSLRRAGSVGSHLVTLTARFGEAAPRRAAAPRVVTAARPSPAAAALRQGRYASALARLEQAADAQPGDVVLAGQLSRLRPLAALLPEDPRGEGAGPLLRQAAAVYVETGDASRGAALLRRAVDAEPGNAAALGWLNALEARAGLDRTARPEQRGQSLAAQYLSRARQAVVDGAPLKAVALARQAVELEPAEIKGWHVLGSAHYVAGQTAEAAAAWKRALALDPGDAAVIAALERVRP